jgi:hypothetical protein
MRVTQDISPGVKTIYFTPTSPLSKFAKVNSVLTPLASQTDTSVTFSIAPVAGAIVEIYFGDDIVIPLGVLTASGFGAVMPVPPADKGLSLILNVSAVSGTTPTMDLKVQRMDEVSGVWFDVTGASFAQVTGVTTALLSIFPGAPAAANSTVNSIIRSRYRIAYTLGGTAPSFACSVSASNN